MGPGFIYSLKGIIFFCCGVIIYSNSNNLPSLIYDTIFIGYGDGYIEYQPSYQLQVRNINKPDANRLLWLMDKTFGESQKVIYVDVDKRVFTDSQGQHLTQNDIFSLFHSRVIFGIDDDFTTRLIDLLTNKYHVSGLKNFFSMTSYLNDSSKFATCEAMIALKKKYQDNERMSYYINLFFPETGVVESMKHIRQLIDEYKSQGIVFKLDKGVCGEGIVILTKDILAASDSNTLVRTTFENNLRKNCVLTDLETMITQKNVIWQAYIDSPMNEIGLPLVLNNQGKYRIGGYGYYLTNTDKSRLASIFSVLDQHWIFASISKESEEIFEGILTELIEHRRFIQAEKGEKPIETLVVGLDIIPTIIENKIVPKVSEVTPWIQGDIRRLPRFLSLKPEEWSIDNRYIVINTEYMSIKKYFTPEKFVQELKNIFDRSFAEYQQVDLDLAIIKEDLTEMKLWVSFYPVNTNMQNRILADFKSFNERLRDTFSIVEMSNGNE